MRTFCTLLGLCLASVPSLCAPTQVRHIRAPAVAPPPPPQEATDTHYNMTWNVLVLSTEESELVVPSRMFQAYGQPYTAVQLVNVTAKSVLEKETEIVSRLVDEWGHPQYAAVVLTSAQLSYENAAGEWVSALSDDQWAKLREYCAKYKVRMVMLTSFPGVDESLAAADGIDGTDVDARITFVDSPFTDSIIGMVKKGAEFKMGNISEFIRTAYWYYPTIVPADAPHIKPFMYINPVNPLPNPECPTPPPPANTANSQNGTIPLRSLTLQNNVTDGACKPYLPMPRNWLGAFVREVDGLEEMHFLFDSNEYCHHGYALTDLWLPWALRGVFVGQRRLLFDTQVDDVFLNTATYNAAQDRGAKGGDDHGYRITSSDLTLHLYYQRRLNSVLPQGSRYVTQLAFNGKGWVLAEQAPDTANTLVTTYRDEFFWITHTWSHLDLYCPDSNCAGRGFTTYDMANSDIAQNDDFTRQVLFADLGGNQSLLEQWPTLSIHSIVTPRISGLNLSASIEAMLDNKHFAAVGDNSRVDLMPENPYHGFPSHVRDTKNRTLFIIPRFPTQIYYDNSLADQNEAEFNSIYGPRCYGFNRTTPVSFPYKCNVNSTKYKRNLTINEIVDMEAFSVVPYLLTYRPDPYMFHQANMRFFRHDGRPQSLLSIWIDSVLMWAVSYRDVPVWTLRMDDLHQYYLDRIQRDVCNVSAKIEFKDGVATYLHVRGNSTCKAKVTRDVASPIGAAAMMEEVYGRDRTWTVSINNGTVSLPLRADTNNTKTPPLPYPPVRIAVSRQNTNITLDAYDDTVKEQAETMVDVLKRHLDQQLDFIWPLADLLKGAACRSNDTDDALKDGWLRLAERGQNDSLALMTGADSWPRMVNDVVTKKAWLLKAQAQEVLSPSMQRNASLLINEALRSHLTELSSYGTDTLAARADVLTQAQAQYNALQRCG